MSTQTYQLNAKSLEPIVRRAALSVPGVIRHTSGINRLTGREFPLCDIQEDHHGPGAEAAEDTQAEPDAVRGYTIDMQIAVRWPSPVNAVAQMVRYTVAQWIIDYTGRGVNAINVEVAAVVPAEVDPSIPQERVTLDDLKAADPHPDLAKIIANPVLPKAEPKIKDHPIRRELRNLPEPTGLPLKQSVEQPEPLTPSEAPMVRPLPIKADPQVDPLPVTIFPEVTPLPARPVEITNVVDVQPVPEPHGLELTIPVARPHGLPYRPTPRAQGLPLTIPVQRPTGLPKQKLRSPKGLPLTIPVYRPTGLPTRPMREPEGLPLTIAVQRPGGLPQRKVSKPKGLPLTIPVYRPTGLPQRPAPMANGLPITIPVFPPSGPVYRPIPKATGLKLREDIPTPEGLPTHTISTPEGLATTVTPSVREDRKPIIVEATPVTWEELEEFEGPEENNHDHR
ncbi:Asp23/Gls24 family envelope stress response protein [Corynebacterium falsenii]|nr:Asp23/Gls24 family envelope stress response protein [Corynebacterium falsenii]